MRSHMRIVVGGGAVGASCLWHLTRAGVGDCVLVEKDELGWEMHLASSDLAVVYDAVHDAGSELGLVDFGSFALNAMRLEKGWHAWGADICVTAVGFLSIPFLPATIERPASDRRTSSAPGSSSTPFEPDPRAANPGALHSVVQGDAPSVRNWFIA